ncbi:MAG: GNAT family N-acetyltransferase [Armatimonadetes bacterium]|nr:GNAT family N-acetyltransferase [Armatimonadota bacterium]
MGDFPEIRTERLLLRPFQIEDVEASLAYRNDVEFARYLAHIPQPFTKVDAEAFVALNMSEPWDKSPTFAVVFEGKLIGTVNLEIDRHTQAAMIGYAIGRTWWGQGLAAEAARAVMNWGIDTFCLSRIWASTDIGNVRSQRVLEKLGMRLETVIDEHRQNNSRESVNELIYSFNLDDKSLHELG